MQPDDTTRLGNIHVDSAKNSFIGSQISNSEINYKIYNPDPTVLHASPLRHVHDANPDMVEPSKLDPLFEALERHWLIVLEAPPEWGINYVAEALAKRYLHKQSGTQPPYEIYMSNGEVNGSALRHELDERKDILKNHPVLIENATKALYPREVIGDLRTIAGSLQTPIILLTQQNIWSETFAGEGFFRLNDDAFNPYSADDLAQWLSKLLAKFSAVPGNAGGFTPETKLGREQITIREIAARLKSPGLITNFPNRYIQLPANADLKPLLEQMVEEGDKRVQQWFDDLQTDEARYVVLTLSLLDSLPPETFWAIYEQLSLAWRERIITLTMSDYQAIRRELQEYITIDDPAEKRRDTRIEFKNPSIRETLIKHASQGYRRSLVQALPVLGGIITGERRDDGDESIVARLRELDILGSELEWLTKTRNKQNELRQRLIGSIVQILQFEPMTTQHLLLSWAESSSYEDIESLNRRRAFSDVIVRMYKSQAPKERAATWYEQRDSTFLLREWYQRFQQEMDDLLLFVLPPAQRNYQLSKELRRANVRSSIAATLCELSEIIRDDSFGSDRETADLFDRVPKEQPLEVNSLWHMLVALAWDHRWTVRYNLAIEFVALLRYHPKRFQSLLNLLASDWQPVVRAQIARTLAGLYTSQGGTVFLYLINDLLDHDRPYFSRKIDDVTHYLKIESLLSEKLEFPEQLWTGILATLYISQTNLVPLTVLLHTRLVSANTPYMHAFRAVLEWLFEDGNDPRRGELAEPLKHILLDRTGDNRASEASLVLEDVLRIRDLDVLNQKNLSDSEKQAFKEARNIPAYI